MLGISNSSALGSPVANTTVLYGGQLRVDGSLTVLGEALALTGRGPNNTGAISSASGNSQFTGVVTLASINTIDALTLQPNAAIATFSGIYINTDPGTSLNWSGVQTGNVDIVKFGGGQLELSGTSANANNQAPRILEGTLLLNKAPGVSALAVSGVAITIGTDAPGNSATLRFGADNQIPGTNNNVTVASTGLLDLANNDQIFQNTLLTVGANGAADINIGAGGTFTSNGDITVHTLGGGHATGATITGGTLGLQLFNTAATGIARTIRVSDGAVGSDLTISSAIVDGTGFQALGVTKIGFGTMQYDGAGPNTYTGPTLVNEGTLLLNKTAGTPAMSGALTIGDNNLQSGLGESDVVRLLAANQLPDYNAPVIVNGTGLLDLAGNSEAIGASDGVNALTLNVGTIHLGAGTLTVNGNITTDANITATGLPGSVVARAGHRQHGWRQIGPGQQLCPHDQRGRSRRIADRRHHQRRHHRRGRPHQDHRRRPGPQRQQRGPDGQHLPHRGQYLYRVQHGPRHRHRVSGE